MPGGVFQWLPEPAPLARRNRCVGVADGFSHGSLATRPPGASSPFSRTAAAVRSSCFIYSPRAGRGCGQRVGQPGQEVIPLPPQPQAWGHPSGALGGTPRAPRRTGPAGRWGHPENAPVGRSKGRSDAVAEYEGIRRLCRPHLYWSAAEVPSVARVRRTRCARFPYALFASSSVIPCSTSGALAEDWDIKGNPRYRVVGYRALFAQREGTLPRVFRGRCPFTGYRLFDGGGDAVPRSVSPDFRGLGTVHCLIGACGAAAAGGPCGTRGTTVLCSLIGLLRRSWRSRNPSLFLHCSPRAVGACRGPSRSAPAPAACPPSPVDNSVHSLWIISVPPWCHRGASSPLCRRFSDPCSGVGAAPAAPFRGARPAAAALLFIGRPGALLPRPEGGVRRVLCTFCRTSEKRTPPGEGGAA